MKINPCGKCGNTDIRILKNMVICDGCHNTMKALTRIEYMVRDWNEENPNIVDYLSDKIKK